MKLLLSLFLLLTISTYGQDSFNVFQNPVDSMRVAAQDVTSEQITKTLNLKESLLALWNLVVLEYIAFVCITVYIVKTRVQFIKTDSRGRRNLLVAMSTIALGIVEYYWRLIPILNLAASALFVNAFYEAIFRWAFKGLEKIGITPLPEWYIEEAKNEKQKDLNRMNQGSK